MSIRCPLCRAHLDIEAMVADEAQDALTAFVYRQPQELRLALVPYLALFRADRRDMTPERTLRLAREVVEMESDTAVLAAALSRAREAVLTKWQRHGRRALKDHAYLAPVIETVRAEGVHPVPERQTHQSQPQDHSRIAQGVAALEAMKSGE